MKIDATLPQGTAVLASPQLAQGVDVTPPAQQRADLPALRAPSLLPKVTSPLVLAEPRQAARVGHDGHAGHVHPPAGDAPGGQQATPPPQVEPMRVVDLLPGARFQLDMHPVKRTVAGQEISGVSYGGSIPGPVLRVQQGSSVDVTLRNRTGAESTLHPHGLRLDWRYDGVPHLGQHPVPPGGEFNYRLTFPDAGVYWYHPHVRDWAVRDQGAYGVFVVRPTDPNYYNPVNREEVLALDDILLSDQSARDGGQGPTTHVFSGMFGDTMLVNGRTDYNLRVRQGEVVRFHVLNAADARVFNLAFPGARVKVVGADIGKNEREEFADSVMIAPAERYTVEVLFDAPGTHQIVSRTRDGTRVLGNVEVGTEPVAESHRAAFERLRENRDVQADIDRYRQHFDRPVDKRLAIDLDFRPPTRPAAPPARATAAPPEPEVTTPRPLWQRTERVFWEEIAPDLNATTNTDNTVWKLVDADTGAVNDDIQWTFNQGDVAKIEIQGGAMQHPIHFHGQRFLVLSLDGVRNPNLQWKDTVLIPAGQRAEILLDTSNPGRWMFHCHIGRHAVDQPNHRMTGYFEVLPR